jgi:two-component sensor histidine kinase
MVGNSARDTSETGSAPPFFGPVAVLVAELHPIGANREFYRAFGTATDTLETTVARLFGEIPEVRHNIRTRMQGARSSVDIRETVSCRDSSGQLRSLLLVPAYASNHADSHAVLVVEDVTERSATAQQLADRLESTELMIEEMRHRMANSMQIIASVVRIKAHLAQSDEARRHLEDVHQRVSSIAEFQDQLDAAADAGRGSVSDYLSAVCGRLATSLIDPSAGIELQVEAADVSVRPETCISIGLVVTELVVNALKHAFPSRKHGHIRVAFAPFGSGWKLSVEDDGVGCDRQSGSLVAGVGTRVVRALARRLGADLEVSNREPSGLTVTLIHPSGQPSVPA